ncbi:MAG: 2'-deoxycytidine 5'-triphosphate deaminase, partial [Myxococcota bacterium]
RRSIDLTASEILVRGEVYVLRLREQLKLPQGVAAYCNNKSSTGRIDLQTRVLTDGNPRYDRVPSGYTGELWIEVIPKSFDIRIREGDSLNQAIFYQARKLLTGSDLRSAHAHRPLLHHPDGRPLDPTDSALTMADDGVLMTLDLEQTVVGYVAKKSYRPIDLSRVAVHSADDFFEPIKAPRDGTLFLSREAFYIFSTYEYISVAPDLAAEMLPYDTSAGEFRAHYAGFFDPGFGHGDGKLRGTPAVLEVRPYEDDLIVRHRQPVCKMAYEQLVSPPQRLYGSGGIKSHYAQQRGPRLSKFFV